MSYRKTVHWAALAGLALIFGQAGIEKVFASRDMVEGMAAIGFGWTWTLLIGVAEVVGVVGLAVGVLKPSIKNAAVLWLLPFGVGAFTVHMSYHHGIRDYWQSLTVCVLSAIVLWADERFRVVLGEGRPAREAST
ncbi:DoxX family protein [Sorangium sp. So ce131]|uniref:DoxX family protein n=1 Tax=Sorangium sp. So ce131 TaxID=3133282 RepID=UPI003F619D1B